MRKIRALIVQAFPAVRAAVREMLREEKDIRLLEECQDGDAAVIALRRHRPQLLFLGVQLPGRHGFEVLRALDGDAPPAVVFVSKFERYAAGAFSVHAVDYLLHPFTRQRFRQALLRARQRLDQKYRRAIRSADVSTQLPADSKRLTLKSKGRIVVLRIDEIDAIVVQRPWSLVYTQAGPVRARFSLDEISQRLPAGKLVRVNRNTLVNLDRIADIHRTSHGDGRLRLEGGREFQLSRRYRAEWSTLLSQSRKGRSGRAKVKRRQEKRSSVQGSAVFE